MEIFELIHLYEGADSRFSIGFFKTPTAAYTAVKKLSTVVGFCDYPEGFFLIPRYVQTEQKDLDKVFAVIVYFYPKEYHGGNYTEFDTYLGFFESQAEADRVLSRYLELNTDGIPGMERLCTAEAYPLDEISDWEEGFTRD